MTSSTAGAGAELELPQGFRIRLREDVQRADGGGVLLGGSPMRAVRLRPAALSLLAEGEFAVTSTASARLARQLLDGNLAYPVLDGVQVQPEELTVVVPVRDRAAELDRCLTALAPLQVVVVDDASVAPDAVAAVAQAHGATLVQLSTNVGPAGARNAGLDRVSTPLVAFVDSDVQVDADALLRLARHCADPALALVAPRVVGHAVTPPGRGRVPWFARYDVLASSLDLGTNSALVRPGAAVGWLPSACLVGRTAHLRNPSVNGFEDSWRVAEDVDLVWRLVGAGFTVRYDAEVAARHEVRGTARAWLARKFVYGTGGVDLAARHGGKVAPAVMTPLMAVAGAALLLRRWWSVPVAAAVGVHAARSVARRLPLEQDLAPTAANLAWLGLVWATRQESALLLRHWWPLAAIAAPFSRSVRRALVTALAVDLVVFLRERQGLNPVIVAVSRRLDDLAYGSGLWWGALRRRDLRCLLPRIMWESRKPRPDPSRQAPWVSDS